MPRPSSARRESSEATRDSLLNHALTLFSERGYAATSVRDIIHAAGVTQPTLYYYFRGKTRLFQALIERHYAESQSRLEQVIGTVLECEPRLRTLTRRSFEFCRADPRVPRLMFQTHYGPRVPEIDGILDALTSRRFRLVTRVMRDGIDHGDLRPSDPEFLALSFCCLMDQPINVFSRRPRPGHYLTTELADALVTQFLHGAA